MAVAALPGQTPDYDWLAIRRDLRISEVRLRYRLPVGRWPCSPSDRALLHGPGYSEQLAVRMSQVVSLLPGDCGVPVMGVLMLVAVSAARHAFFGGVVGALPL